MPGSAEAHGPTYISSRSADVILSDIRPIKLNIEALRSINVLLDEFLYSILNAGRSLSTHQLRAGLLKVLPTTLGKEALLEAEMELRAYLERTGASAASLAAEEQGKEFNLQWSFELLRLKCQAYSTLSDSDEDSQAETRLTERMGKSLSGASPPKPVLVAPAALYLTAILESICEHVLSNVGRVAARDSSRTNATVQDLYVALCEDESIYGLFKTMKVYDKIENLSKVPKPRRSKSFSRSNDHSGSLSRNSSLQQIQPTPSLNQSASLPPRSRISSETPGSMATTLASSHGPTNSRSSFDKTRAMKLFSNNRSSADQGAPGSLNESQRSHKRSDSVLSDGMKQTIAAFNGSGGGDQASLGTASLDDQEFDDMMRSGATMKVSLTPDRLKSMEVYNKEKGQRGSRKPVPRTDSKSSLRSNEKINKGGQPELPHRVNGSQLSGSIVEDEEYFNRSPGATGRTRQGSVPSPISPSTPPVTAAATRLRSVSASMPPVDQHSHALRKSSKTSSVLSPSPTTQTHKRVMPSQQIDPMTGTPIRTRRVVRNRESIDLDDVMGGASEDDAPEVVKQSDKSTKQKAPYPVSAGARDLIDFLAEGPPDMPDVPMGVGAGGSSMSLDTPNKAKGGRLQRMFSKLTLKDGEQRNVKTGSGGDSFSRSRRTPSTVGVHSAPIPIPSPPIMATKPIPPRPPPVVPISPPSSPSQTSLSEAPPSPRTRRPSNGRKPVPGSTAQDMLPPRIQSHSKSVAVNGQEKPRSSSGRVPKQSLPSANGSSTVLSAPPERHSSKKAVETVAKPSPSVTLTNNVKEMQHLLGQATNAAECRLIVDMFLAKSGLYLDSVDSDTSYPSPPSDNVQDLPSVDLDLEYSLVELFLGGTGEEIGSDEEEPLSPADTIASKDTPVTFPVSPPYTPLPAHGNGKPVAHPIDKDTLTATA